MITHHTQLLNALIEKYEYKSYLEIGVQNPANNFDLIRCEQRTGIDPELQYRVTEVLELRQDYGADGVLEFYRPDSVIHTCTSDDFFGLSCNRDMKFDLIFIDGLHHADQVKRDFENSLRCLSPNGRIVIHDVLPENEEGTKVPRETKVWWGDVYKFAMTMGSYFDVGFRTFDIDNGCMVVWKEPDFIKWDVDIHNWESYQQEGRELMNVTDEVTI